MGKRLIKSGSMVEWQLVRCSTTRIREIELTQKKVVGLNSKVRKIIRILENGKRFPAGKSPESVFFKMSEELGEIGSCLAAKLVNEQGEFAEEKMKEEFGDLFMQMCQFAHLKGYDFDAIFEQTCRKIEKRTKSKRK